MAFAIHAYHFITANYKEIFLTISVVTKYEIDNTGLRISQQRSKRQVNISV